jgi:MHS family proline/betaine transporter-like MFS transporter
MNESYLNKEQKRVILAVTFGNILEWFEIYSYAYLAPIIAKAFFNFESELSNLFSAFIIFGSGFITRPFGAVLFGRIGDLLGRKKAFILSIVVMTVPTFLMGCLPTYNQIGLCAPLLLGLLRLAQSVPAAGEAPGTFCFLYENAHPGNRKFMTSWGAVGNQIGAILGVIETFLMDQFMSDEFLMSWGWRISFWSGGLIGLLGFYLRRKLHETPFFIRLKQHHRIDTETVSMVIKNYRHQIVMGTAFGVLNAATFYLIATYVPIYFSQSTGLNHNSNLLLHLSILTIMTVLLPLFGKTESRFSCRSIFLACTISIIILLLPLYISINNGSFFWASIVGGLGIIPVICMTAFLPYLLAHLFPVPVRFTGVGLSFNLADGIVGGFTPAIALFLLQYTNNQAAFCWFILACAIISLISYFKISKTA